MASQMPETEGGNGLAEIERDGGAWSWWTRVGDGMLVMKKWELEWENGGEGLKGVRELKDMEMEVAMDE